MVEISYFIVLGFLVLPALDYFVGLRVLPDVVPSGEKDEKSSVFYSRGILTVGRSTLIIFD